VASGVARNTWRQIIHNLTSNPLEGEIVKGQLRITDEMINLKPPSFPSPKVLGLGVGDDERVREKEKNIDQYRKELDQYEHRMLEYKTKLENFSQKLLEFGDVANEAAKNGLLFPKHR
jgi:hypothetical protein